MRLCSFKTMPLSCIPVKTKGVVVLMIFCFQALEPLPAEDSTFQFALLLWYSVFVFFFCSWALLEKISHVCAVLHCVQLLTQYMGLISLSWFPCVFSAAQRLSLLAPALVVCTSAFGKCFIQYRIASLDPCSPGLRQLVSLQGACWETATQAHPDWPYPNTARSSWSLLYLPSNGCLCSWATLL